MSCLFSFKIAAIPQDFRGDKSPEDKLLESESYCASAKEFKQAYSFFLQEKDFPLPNQKYLSLSLEIAKGCTGAASRFSKIYSFLKISGVDLKKSIEAGIEFANKTDQQTNNFIEIFPQIYLKEFYDLDFWIALNVSLRLSDVAKGPIDQIRTDFTKITKFCLTDPLVGMPIKSCAELALFLAERSQYFPNGTADSFIEDFKFLRKDPRFGLSVQSVLKILKEVFAFGPMAPKNFKEALEYAISTKGLNLKIRNALSLSLKIARESSRDLPPPVIQEKPKESSVKNELK